MTVISKWPLKSWPSKLAKSPRTDARFISLSVYGSSFGSYNLSSDSFALNPLGYNSQASFDVSNNSFDISNPTTSLLDPNTYGPSSSSASISTTYTPNYGQTNPTYNQSAINLQSINYSAVSSSYGGAGGGGGGVGGSSANYVPALSSTSNYAFDAQRRSIDDQLKQLDEALMSKVSEMSLLSSSIRSNKLQLQQMTSSLNRNLIKGQSSIDITVGNGSAGSSTSSSASSSATKISADRALSNLSAAKKKGLSTSCKNVSNYDQETFY